MAEPSSNPTPQIADPELQTTTNGADVPPADVEMTDSAPTTEVLAQPQPTIAPPAPAPAPTPTIPAPTPAPVSSRNSPHPSAPQQAPTQPIPHGSPTRIYLNQRVTPHLLEAMKHLATTEPDKPLKWLSEFLAQKSAEIEG
ncbi:hypothetical protein P153DRAFT_393772 [Dothidotthia symphoricarpi CBS 119687]|uniref:Dpy-30 domain-containing protein n=1 Tax=Dothidotthia symphoricarpi CBS 119687 TaxID=1392245 RepID=A0A6A6ALZ9_9PLEO|nr:uncharacterized protein P153DRAFT_393772 [Dothidotthia symphoricarpi CBS 119687]KAF2132820.1 hypothetical protein P153DRAFT_393772 [Dothidotthia symphoricarpi CBS 119687]